MGHNDNNNNNNNNKNQQQQKQQQPTTYSIPSSQSVFFTCHTILIQIQSKKKQKNETKEAKLQMIQSIPFLASSPTSEQRAFEQKTPRFF